MRVRNLFFMLTIVVMLTIAFFTDMNALLLLVLIFVIGVGGPFIVDIMSEKKRRKSLYQKCDPELFLKMTKKKLEKYIMNIEGRKGGLTMTKLLNDQAVAYVELGDFIRAKGILESINPSDVPQKNMFSEAIAYNRIICCYETGDLTGANQLIDYYFRNATTFNDRTKILLSDLEANHSYYSGKGAECREYFQQFLSKTTYPLAKVKCIFRLAQIDEQMGFIEQAISGYRIVVEQGNKLWVVNESKRKLEELI